ncbi:kinesin family member 10 [Pelomyxa schiedti]|nr:kinesin family member 10 [Pelomyxa schiedti]
MDGAPVTGMVATANSTVGNAPVKGGPLPPSLESLFDDVTSKRKSQIPVVKPSSVVDPHFKVPPYTKLPQPSLPLEEWHPLQTFSSLNSTTLTKLQSSSDFLRHSKSITQPLSHTTGPVSPSVQFPPITPLVPARTASANGKAPSGRHVSKSPVAAVSLLGKSNPTTQHSEGQILCSEVDISSTTNQVAEQTSRPQVLQELKPLSQPQMMVPEFDSKEKQLQHDFSLQSSLPHSTDNTINLSTQLDYKDESLVFKGNGYEGDASREAADSNNKINQRITVFVRVRPSSLQEIQLGFFPAIEVVDTNTLWFDREPDPEDHRGGSTKHRFKNKMFSFDRVFNDTSTQEEVYSIATEGLIDSVLDGYNATVFAYGATGSGKTHTMIGNAQYGPGVMGLAMKELFQKIKNDKEHTINVKILCIEVYNEKIRDLFSPDSPPIEIRESGKQVVLTGVTTNKPQSWEEVHEMLQFANKNRTQHPTDTNAESSRSHAVFQIIVERTTLADSTVTSGKLSLIDLAGSERATSTTNHSERQKEGAAINKSLLALANCINALGNPKYKKGSYIPFRDSKLTRLLKDSLGGNCRTVMIANVSPSSKSLEDTFNTLEYAKRTKEIKVQVSRTVINYGLSPRQYKAIIDDLNEQLKEEKSRSQQLAWQLEHDRTTKYKLPQRTSTTDQFVKKLQEVLSKRTAINHQLTSSITAQFSSWRTITSSILPPGDTSVSPTPADVVLQANEARISCIKLVEEAQDQCIELSKLAEVVHTLADYKAALQLELGDYIEKDYLSELRKQSLNCSALSAISRYLLQIAKSHNLISPDIDGIILGLLSASAPDASEFQPVKLSSLSQPVDPPLAPLKREPAPIQFIPPKAHIHPHSPSLKGCLRNSLQEDHPKSIPFTRFSPAKRVKFETAPITQKKISSPTQKQPSVVRCLQVPRKQLVRPARAGSEIPAGKQIPSLRKPPKVTTTLHPNLFETATAAVTAAAQLVTPTLHSKLSTQSNAPKPSAAAQQQCNNTLTHQPKIIATSQQPHTTAALLHSKRHFANPLTNPTASRKEKLRAMSEMTRKKARTRWH